MQYIFFNNYFSRVIIKRPFYKDPFNGTIAKIKKLKKIHFMY